MSSLDANPRPDSPRMVLHVGMYKTATTSLQQNLFERHPQIVNLGKPYKGDDQANAVSKLIHLDRISMSPEEAAEIMGWAVPRNLPNGAIAIFSEEDLAHFDATDRLTIAERLKTAFGPSKVLITIRDQRALLKSLYAFLLRGADRWRSFDEWLDYHSKYRHGTLFESLHYDRLIETYRGIFGAEAVNVMLYEDLVENPEGFGRSLCEWLGVDPDVGVDLIKEKPKNERLSQGELRFRRFRNQYLPKIRFSRFYPKFVTSLIYGALSKAPSVKTEMSTQWAQRLEQLYEEGNRRLEREFGFSLREKGYAVASAARGG